MKKMIIILISISSLLPGCASLTALPADKYAKDEPPAYKEGFNNGCFSGQSAAGDIYSKYNKDVKRANTDELYKQGWDDGYAYCNSKQKALSRDFR